MSYDREKRVTVNSKGNKKFLQSVVPAKQSGDNGDERIIKTADGKLRLYRKELGTWYYLEFTRS
jgi:hypothetical protein|tara:strand:- start:73 stop:264 length:192 start_codon:yes stop_codon:yes gene_type:complete